MALCVMCEDEATHGDKCEFHHYNVDCVDDDPGIVDEDSVEIDTKVNDPDETRDWSPD